MYICQGIAGTFQSGKVILSEYDQSKAWDPKRPAEYILLGETDVTVEIPKIDVNAEQIEALEKVVTSVRAEAQQQVNIILDRISKLKSIGHDGGEA